MATPASRLIRDQNLNILYNGATPLGKNDLAKPSKKGGGLGGRKALNDISNSNKPSVLQSIKKDTSANVISIEKDPSIGKAKILKAAEKGKVGGRKALGDLTNSVKPSSQQAPKTGRKLIAVAEDVPSTVAEERFLHNHQECIKAQNKAVDMDYFLKSVELVNDNLVQLPSIIQPSLKQAESKKPHLEMDEIPEAVGYRSPLCQSPKSPEATYMDWEDDNLSDLMAMEMPKLLNH